MTIVVEDGSGKATANSYAAVADADGYHLARRNDPWFLSSDADLKAAALIRSTAYIDATYRLRFSGLRTFRRAQALEWPRLGAYVKYSDANLLFVQEQGGYGYAYWNYDFIPNNVVPVEVVNAVCEGALREMVEPGVLAPDLDRGGGIRRLQAGSVSVQYGSNATPNTVFQAIDIALASLLAAQNPYSGKVSRG